MEEDALTAIEDRKNALDKFQKTRDPNDLIPFQPTLLQRSNNGDRSSPYNHTNIKKHISGHR